MKNNSYFSAGEAFNFGRRLDRLLNPYCNNIITEYRGSPLQVSFTRRAGRQLEKRSQPLIVEMQLYFSCVALKRVLFHEQTDFSGFPLTNKLHLAFNTVESESCDPVQFAEHHPAKRRLDSARALKMRPRRLLLDYRKDHWTGEYMV